MLKVYKGSMTLWVSNGAFRSIYAPSGWAVVEDVSPEPPQGPLEAPLGGEGDYHPLEKKMLSQDQNMASVEGETDEDTLNHLTEAELRQYASLLGIKPRGLKRGQLLKAIKAKEG